jgi:Protein of unknown function (DUF2599)
VKTARLFFAAALTAATCGFAAGQPAQAKPLAGEVTAARVATVNMQIAATAIPERRAPTSRYRWHPDYINWATMNWDSRRLEVHPSWYGDYYASADPATAFQEALDKAGVSNSFSGSQRSTMYNQFRCHADWWEAKWLDGLGNQWNLDIDRPDVGYWTTVRRFCNP